MEKSFSWQNKLNKSKNCKHKSRKALIFKLGGLLCPNCRIILYEAYSKKWLKLLREAQNSTKVERSKKED